MIRRAALFCLLLASCKADRPNEERRLPQLLPPSTMTVPDSLRIPVEAGGEVSVLDAQALKSRPPDFGDEERAAWRLDRLIPAAAEPGAGIIAESAGGVAVTFENRESRTVVLLLNRRGEISVGLLDVERPFPAYHGTGGRMKRRPADVPPFVADVSRIRVVDRSP